MKIHFVLNTRRTLALFLSALFVLPACVLFAQGTPSLTKPGKYTGRNITGELIRNQRVNISQLASAPTGQVSSAGADIQRHREDALHPPVRDSGAVISRAPAEPLSAAAAPTPSCRGFTGLTHFQQRTARNGNQFSTEPPDQGLAVGNGLVLEGVNSASMFMTRMEFSSWRTRLLSPNFSDYRPELTAPPVSMGCFPAM